MAKMRLSNGVESVDTGNSGGIVGDGGATLLPSLTNTGPTAAPDDGVPVASSVAPTATKSSPPDTASSSTSTSTSTSIIQFSDATNFQSPGQQIWMASSGVKLFEWTRVNESVSITGITWYARNDWASSFHQGSPVVEKIDIGITGPSSDTAIENVTNTSAQLVLNNSMVAPYLWWIMAIRLDWETEIAGGYSESGVFTVGDSRNMTAFHDFTSNLAAFPSEKSSSERITSYKTKLNTGGTSGSIPTSHENHRGGGGLSTGAKIGIGVAVALIGLGIIGALVFSFLLSKRRKNSRGKGSALPVERDGDADGEGDGDASKPSVIESPQPADYPAQRDVGTPLCREDTDSNIALNRRSKNDSLLDSAAGGVSRHLVEEGMTREEILRLEEEERHLDAEIERAARRE